jgi:hypothetical protein
MQTKLILFEHDLPYSFSCKLWRVGDAYMWWCCIQFLCMRIYLPGMFCFSNVIFVTISRIIFIFFVRNNFLEFSTAVTNHWQQWILLEVRVIQFQLCITIIFYYFGYYYCFDRCHHRRSICEILYKCSYRFLGSYVSCWKFTVPPKWSITIQRRSESMVDFFHYHLHFLNICSLVILFTKLTLFGGKRELLTQHLSRIKEKCPVLLMDHTLDAYLECGSLLLSEY